MQQKIEIMKLYGFSIRRIFFNFVIIFFSPHETIFVLTGRIPAGHVRSFWTKEKRQRFWVSVIYIFF